MADKKADSGSESDSTEEPVVGNVNKFAVVPPGFTGRPKKGHLIFDACFECGNLGRVDYITEYEYDLFIRPDTCNPRFRVWFNFTVENVRTDQRVIFNIVNFSKTKSLYREGMSPFVKSTSRPKWVRVPAKHVYYYRCPDHRKNYVMSFAFIFDKEDDVYQFAYCYPYSYTRLQNYLDNLEKRNMDYFTRELLCLTVQQRRLDLITITHPDNLYPEETKRIVFVTARVHPGETPSSFVCQGFIDFLIGNHPVAKTLREHIVFKVVPMLNPDGVFLGNYRCSLMGFDLNRHWQEPSPWAHPTLYATKNLLMEYDRDEKLIVDFFIDLHAHSTLMNGFMYGNTYDDMERYERQSVFPKLLCGNAEDFSLANTNFNRDAVKAGTGRRTLGGCLDENSHCYTLEVSFFSYQSTTGQAMPYTEEGYMKLGRNLARTFVDYYKLAGVVSAKPSSSIVPKPGAYRIRDRNVQERSNTDSQFEEKVRDLFIYHRAYERDKNGIRPIGSKGDR
ncbi:cytosolic carboxypeptidase 6-like isoform X3 [Dreissena polymorpha]|uniref:cytosolic carboxypeptidase 6-like isoform X3 n=1 Tax=Dreissena polymorpha TaxID=45954 RepID=UPI0022651975|nr:cytosolic carboxypeptidase 6-like isoform X3 [Dreissena polymorpha]